MNINMIPIERSGILFTNAKYMMLSSSQVALNMRLANNIPCGVKLIIIMDAILLVVNALLLVSS